MENREQIRIRFAPSPTGFLHVGNARTALFNWLFARKKGGIFVLRIEDTDEERSFEKYEKKLMEDLKWLTLDWDEGPFREGPVGPYRQSQRLHFYKSFTEKLLEEGKAYYCFCSKQELETEKKQAISAGKNPVYSGKCRGISLEEAQKKRSNGQPSVVRLKTPGAGELSFEDMVRGRVCFDLKLLGDPVIVRSNGIPGYNYAVVIDDSLMKITHVIRGEDHISNMPRQILTYAALSFPVPKFAHLSMVMGEDNTRLSKRHGATSVDQFKKDGILPAALINYLALLGWAAPDGSEILDRDDLIRMFEIRKVSRSSAIFDFDKLHWLNRQHMKKLPLSQQAEQAYPFLREAGLMPEEQSMSKDHWNWLEKAVGSFIEKVDRFSDLSEHFNTMFDFSPNDLDSESGEILRSACAQKVLRSFSVKMTKIKILDFDKYAEMTKEIKAETGCKGKDLFHPLRVALTLKSSGLDLEKFIPLVEEGAQLVFPKPLLGCARRLADVLGHFRLE